MSEDIKIDPDNWNDEMEKECVCGHSLTMHGFTMQAGDEHSQTLRVSQCVVCGSDKCKCFRPKDE